MKFTIVRNIFFHSPNTGLVARHVCKEVNSEVAPQIGFEFEDSAWHRKDPIRAESISIDAATGNCTVTLNPKEVGDAAEVEKVYQLVVQHHEWKSLSAI